MYNPESPSFPSFMDIALNLVLPIFAIMGVGHTAARLGLLGDAAIDGIDRYVFTFAIPALLFRALSATELPDALPWTLWLTYYGATLTIWAVGFTVVRLILGRSVADSIMIGFGCAQGNTVMLGIPIILTVLGDAAGPPLFFIIGFHGLILITVATIALEWARSRSDSSPGQRSAGVSLRSFGSALRGTLLNPVILGLLGGVIYGQLGVPIPEPIDRGLEMLGRSAIPCALFVIGAVLTRHRLGRNVAPAVIAATLKLIVHPALVWLVATYIFTLPPLWITVATILAAMPTGVYCSILANRYRVAPEVASGLVVMATAASLVTITILLTQLGEMTP